MKTSLSPATTPTQYWKACLFLLIAGISACSNSTGPSRPAPQFTAALISAPASGVPNPVVATGAMSVSVNGVLTSPYACYTLSARDEITDATLTIYITAKAPGNSCAATVGYFEYNATALNVPATVTHLKVIEIVGTAPPKTVVDQSVDLTATVTFGND